ncbi:MAG TPA: hypothetical protein VHT04_03195, partial [Stellaceae bacterium]|nr:hypothetical protein [Stellaceae bacterium]
MPVDTSGNCIGLVSDNRTPVNSAGARAGLGRGKSGPDTKSCGYSLPLYRFPSTVVARSGLTISIPEKSFSLSLTTMQPFASATAAMIMSSALRLRPLAVPSAISRAQIKAAFS